MNWILEHCGDVDFNDPVHHTHEKMVQDTDDAVLMSLVDNLGCFTVDQVRFGLRETGGEVERAADWLFSHMDDLHTLMANATQTSNQPSSTTPTTTTPQLDDGDGNYELIGLISHIGNNTASGHYVCHLKKGDNWVIFNDEKVAISEHPPFLHAYMYLYRRLDVSMNEMVQI